MIGLADLWCYVVKHGLVTLVVIAIRTNAATFQVLFILSLFYAWNITTAEINSGVYLLMVESAKCLCLFPMVLVLVLLFWHKLKNFEFQEFWLKNFVLFTSLSPTPLIIEHSTYCKCTWYTILINKRAETSCRVCKNITKCHSELLSPTCCCAKRL